MNAWSLYATKGKGMTPSQRTALRHNAAVGATALQTMLARADVAFARNLLRPTYMKGPRGEFLAENFVLNNQLEQDIRGHWIPLTPRSGPQGLDHLFMKTGKNGHLYWMVGESKYGSSQLGVTVDGARQLSTEWTSKRIRNLGAQYCDLAVNSVELKPLPHVSPKAQFDVAIGDKTLSFWKDDDGRWFFNGSLEELRPARDMAAKMGNNLLSVNCNIRVRLFHIDAIGNDLKVTLYHVKPDEVTTISKMTPSKSFTVPELLGHNISDTELKKEIANAFRKHFPEMSDEELRQEAENIAKRYKNGDLLHAPRPLWQTVISQTAWAAGVAGTLDVAAQLVLTGKIVFGKALLAAGGAALGATSGQIVGIMLLKTAIGRQAVRSLAGFLNLGTSMTRGALSGMGGGIVAAAFLPYGSWLLGYCDIRQANRQAVAGIGGTLAGSAAGLGVAGLVAHFGTCGTGAAIAGLHGAAATNATLAWLGLGTVANGGFGVAGGFCVLGGCVTVAAVAVSSLIALGFSLYDANDRRQYALLLATKYKDNGIWNVVANKRLPANLQPTF